MKIHANLLAAFIGLILWSCSETKETADVIFLDGKVYTVDSQQEWAEAFAIKDGRFIAVGTSAEVKELEGPDTEVVNLNNQFVMPGVIDTHIHPLRSQLMEDVDFYVSAADPPTPEAFLEILGNYAKNNPDKKWITGAAFSWASFENTTLNSEFIDQAVSDRPVVIEDETGHIAIANSKALEIAGVTEDTEDPVGGYFGRDDTGKLNGLLYETAMQEVFKHSENYSLEQIYDAGKKVFARLNAMGITGSKIAQGDSLWMQSIKQLDLDGNLKMQVSLFAYEKDFYREYSNINAIMNRELYETDHFKVDGIKLLADGVPFGRTMYIKRNYPNTEHRGVPYIKPNNLIEKVVKYNGMGISCMVHATGDAAADLVIQGTEQSMKANGAEEVRALRNHIAHNVIVDPNDFERMKNCNITMEFSPSFWFPRPIISSAVPDLGPVMIQQVWPFGVTARAGVNVAIGSDWNQAQADPFINIETLVTRKAPGAGPDDEILGEESAASLETVLRSYTMGGAHAIFQENEIGSIETGKRADFIVLDQNLLDIPENKIHETIVLQTYFEGELAYEGTEKVSF